MSKTISKKRLKTSKRAITKRAITKKAITKRAITKRTTSKKAIIKRNLELKNQYTQKMNKHFEKMHKKLLNMKNTNTYIPKLKIKPKTYITRDYLNPVFKVVINNKKLTVFVCKYKGDCICIENNTKENVRKCQKDREIDICIYDEICLETSKYVGYWPGFDSNNMHGPKGNSILVKVNNHEYIYIGREIYRFNTLDIIEDYITPEYKDEQFPMAYGTDNIYFVANKQYRNKKKLLINVSVANYDEIKEEYLNNGKNKNNEGVGIPKIKIKNKNNHRIKNIKIIHPCIW
ncbi:hypothetical protein Hokovirus_2_247 [Hokovirus HKV1]|mgnify:CR=1 FL=1|uniref:Uncharacterized protein n=1 Tax=Hokovirus HKV1 TaxID=1977638 RepID=A0A1V0SG72_9VIRU|nr:hypothetical protein Hokovirus_2_247 [Hokovirus HKV1]